MQLWPRGFAVYSDELSTLSKKWEVSRIVWEYCTPTGTIKYEYEYVDYYEYRYHRQLRNIFVGTLDNCMALRRNSIGLKRKNRYDWRARYILSHPNIAAETVLVGRVVMSSSIVSNWEPRYSKDDSTISDRDLTSRTVLDGVISKLSIRPKGDL